MEKIPLSKFAVALLSALVCSSSTYAQGIYQGSLRIDNIDDFAIDSESNEPLTFRFESPLDGFPASISWSASGGIQIVGESYKTASADWTSAPADYYEVKVKTLADDYSNGSSSFNKYSKGRLNVHVVYDPNVCSCHCDYFDYFTSDGVTYSADIYKRFNPQNANGIAGQACAVKGDEVTFSVEPWVSNYSPGSLGFDEYTWSGYETIAKGGALKYHSNDWSSITFDVADNVESVEGTSIKCAVGKANTGKPLSITLTDAVAAPVVQYSYVINGNTVTADLKSDERLLCLPAEVNAVTLTIKNYSESLSNGFSFEWTSDDGFKKTAENVDAQGSSTFVTDGGEHDATLVVNGGNCGTSEFVYNVRRSLSNDAAIVFGVSSGACVPGNTSYGSLTLTGVDATNRIQWDFVDEDTHGWEITENNGTQNTTRPNVKVGTTGITVSANSYYCPSAEPVVQFLAITPSAPQFVQSENFCLEYKDYDASTAVRYEVKPDPLAVKWEWTFPDGWDATEAEYADGKYVTYTNSIDAIPDKDMPGYVRVKSYGLNGCSGSNSASKRVGFIYPKPQLDIIDGCPNPGGEITMRLTEAEGFTASLYHWDLGGITKSLNNGFRHKKDVTFTVLKDKGAASYTVSVYPQGTCDVSKSTATYDIDVETPFYIEYRYKGANSIVTQGKTEALTMKTIDPSISTSNERYTISISWVVQKLKDGEVYYAQKYNGSEVLNLPYSKYKPGETVHIIVEASLFDSEVEYGENDLIETDDGEIALRCNTKFEFDFLIDTSASGTLFLGSNKLLSVASFEEEDVAYSLNDIKVYPNPTDGVVIFELPQQDDFMLTVYDVSGRLITTQKGCGKTVSADLSGYGKGSYPCQLSTSIGTMSNVVILR